MNVLGAIYCSPLNKPGVDGRRSVKRQLCACRSHMAAKPEVCLFATYLDEKPSAAGRDRPGLADMMSAARERRFSHLFVRSIRCLATPPTAAARIVEELASFEVRVVSVRPDAGLAAAAIIRSVGLDPMDEATVRPSGRSKR